VARPLQAVAMSHGEYLLVLMDGRVNSALPHLKGEPTRCQSHRRRYHSCAPFARVAVVKMGRWRRENATASGKSVETVLHVLSPHPRLRRTLNPSWRGNPP